MSEDERRMMTMWFRGRSHERYKITFMLLEAKFGPLKIDVWERVSALPEELLRQLLVDLLKAQSLRDLGLENGSNA